MKHRINRRSFLKSTAVVGGSLMTADTVLRKPLVAAGTSNPPVVSPAERGPEGVELPSLWPVPSLRAQHFDGQRVGRWKIPRGGVVFPKLNLRQWAPDPAWESDPNSGLRHGERYEWEALYTLIHQLQDDCLVFHNSSSDRPGQIRYFPVEGRTAEHFDFVYRGRVVEPRLDPVFTKPDQQRVYLPLQFETTISPGWFWRKQDELVHTSAGTIDKPELWHHFQRFNRALESIDPPAEGFEPVRVEHPQLRIYCLRGKTTLLAWRRDRENDWRAEFERYTLARTLSALQIKLSELGLDPAIRRITVEVYDPWKDAWQRIEPSETTLVLPDFQRSLVLRARQDGRQPTTKGSEARTSKREASSTPIPEAKQP